jgi:nucleotide-binding universal stress UspA family protein
MPHQEPRTILCPTDFSNNANHAIPYAVAIANNYNSKLHLLHVITIYNYDPNNPRKHFPAIDTFYKESEDGAHEMLDGLPLARAEGIEVEKVLRRGYSPQEEIISFANEKDIDLIVISSHGYGMLGQLMLGSVTAQVCHYAPCPVFCVKRKERELLDPATGRLMVKNILVPVDFSSRCDDLLKVALRKAKIYNSRVHLVHVIHANLSDILQSTGLSSILDASRDIKPLIEKKLSELIECLPDNDVEFTTAIEEGAPAGTLAKYGEKHDIDIIIVGKKGIDNTKHLLGSVTQRLLHTAKCPVYVV